MDGKGVFQISELGEKVLHPRNDNEKAQALTNAVLNVPLWKEIYQKHGKKPRDDNFWAVLVDITKIDPETAKNNATKILGWFVADIGHVSDDLIGQKIEASNDNIETKGLSSNEPNTRSMAQQLVPQDSLGMLTVPEMGNIVIKNEDTLAIARTYLDVLEKKLKTAKSEKQP